MNQDSNNLNQENYNTQGNNRIPNNQPLNNQSFNQGVGVNQQPINHQSHLMSSFPQPIMQEPTPQSTNNTFESGNVNNQNLNNKSPKKMSCGLIIGIVIIVAAIVLGIILIPKLFNSNGSKSNNGKTSGNNLTIGGQKIDYSSNYSEDSTSINGFGLFKINNEYVYKGGDNYTEIDNSGNTSAKYEQGYLNNIVKFNNNYWRIVKINFDGTIKLIYFGTLENGKIVNKLDLQIKYFNDGATDLTYEKSNLREYLNSTVLNNTSLIPTNYTDYLVKSKWDISKYNIYIKETVSSETSNYQDYIGVISIQEYKDATYCYWITTGTGYKTKLCDNYIDNILNTATNTKQLKTNTANIVVSENGSFTGVAKIERSNGEFVTSTEYEVYRQLDNNVLPVITLRSNIKFDSGKGNLNDPYIIK